MEQDGFTVLGDKPKTAKPGLSLSAPLYQGDSIPECLEQVFLIGKNLKVRGRGRSKSKTNLCSLRQEERAVHRETD